MSKKIKRKKSKATKIIAATLSGVLFFCTFFLFWTVITSRMKGKAPSLFGYTFNIVVSESMYPEIKIKDLVIAKKVKLSSIKPGDDIVFLSDDPQTKGLRIVHRVLCVNDDGSFTTYHLNENVGSSRVSGEYPDRTPARRIEGKVVCTNRSLGKIMAFVQSGRNLLFGTLLIFLSVLLISQTVKIIKTAKGEGNPDDGESKA